MSALGSLSPDDKKKLDNAMSVGLRVLQDVEDQNSSLKDLVKNVSEELGIKPASLMKAIKLTYKAKFADEKDAFSTVEDIVDLTGHG